MRVHAIQTGTVRIHERQRRGKGRGVARFANTLLDAEWTEPLPIYSWIVEHPEGLIVVDTGETSRAVERGYFPGWHPYYRLAVRVQVEADQEVGPQMRAAGLDPVDVRWVVMTHLHTDHAGGLHHFPRSEILVSRREYTAARGPMGKLRGYLPHRWPKWLRPMLLDRPDVDDPHFGGAWSLTRAGDVRIVETPGHTAGHVSVIVEEGVHSLFLAGDTSYSEANLMAGAVDGVASMGAGENAAADTLRKIRAYAAERRVVYLPSHDPDSGARLSERRVVELVSPDPLAEPVRRGGPRRAEPQSRVRSAGIG